MSRWTCTACLVKGIFSSSSFTNRVFYRGFASLLSSPLSKPILRPYQQECIRDCLNALENGHKRIGISSPTGSGKTTIFTELIAQIPPRSNGGNKVLVLVNAIELAKQAARHIKKMLPHFRVEIEQGAHRATGDADVTVAMVQSLVSADRIEKFRPDEYKAIIIDEAHHAAAKSYYGILEHFGCTSKDTETSVLGFSATLRRHDGRSLGVAFDHIVFHISFLDLVKQKWLCDVKFTTVQLDIDLDSVSVGAGGDFNRRQLAKVMNRPLLNDIAVRAWMDRAKDKRKSTLVFCADISHVEALTERFRQSGIDAKCISSLTDKNARDVILQDFRDGRFPILINCDILTEGADIPQVDCVMIARPTRSLNLFQQMIGRGMRLAEGKKDCLMLDFVGSFKGGLVCIPTLFGLGRDEVIDEATVEDLAERKKERLKEEILGQEPKNIYPRPHDPSSLVYIDYDNPEDVNDDACGLSPSVKALSEYNWVGCGNEKYILDLMGQGYIQVTWEDDRYIARDYHIARDYDVLEGRKFRKPVVILAGDELGFTIRGCDTYTQKRCRFHQGLLRKASWRQKPASEKQRKIVGEIAKDKPLTKGQAANIITRRFHGAKKNYKEKKKLMEQEQKKRDRLRKFEEQLAIQIGNL